MHTYKLQKGTTKIGVQITYKEKQDEKAVYDKLSKRANEIGLNVGELTFYVNKVQKAVN